MAEVMNSLPGVLCCHEGYQGCDKSVDPVLPLINLENAQAYADPNAAIAVVKEKRSIDVINAAAEHVFADRVIDVAYYNSMIGNVLLQAHSSARMVAIIRNCADFVRSCTTLTGEDPLPVGWPDKSKQLTKREAFIGMGRIRPRRDSVDRQLWRNWSAISKNIWLWEQTNQIICELKLSYPKRVLLTSFETFVVDPNVFWNHVTTFLQLPKLKLDSVYVGRNAVNQKPFDYQIGPPDTWPEPEKATLSICQRAIDRRAQYDC